MQAGEKQWGTDEAVFNMVLCTRSNPQLKATFEAYRTITGKGIIDSIKRETSGALQEGYLAIGKHAPVSMSLCGIQFSKVDFNICGSLLILFCINFALI